MSGPFDDRGLHTDSEVVRYRVGDNTAVALIRSPPLKEDFPAPSNPAYGWEGVASIVELPNGDFLAAWFAGKYELSSDSGIYGARLRKGSTEWTAPAPLIDAPGVGEGNPVLFFHNDTLCFTRRFKRER